ncbi:tyrosine-type recombinase/integrase [Chryseobacterium suipulveris]|uniref:Tyrosine-type recombinase/integrase n=1 Tax=Chryseobacterium suipulveris TaxID=2929800 RepID=A0ABY4BMR9_9FLAO|nr:tyrosine-type recombinase/integrase [Chryseobacterium suipulveris]UOE40492.1 tyrosine-type recombinase/integrase [Chryseobacterium suipulveris]
MQRFERNISILGRSPRTFDNYSRHVAALALHFGTLPTELDPEQVKDYLFELQQRSKTPSQTYFKHTVYGLRFLLKTEGLPYSYLHLPAIPKVKKLPVILSREEIWRMLQAAELLKHKLLIGLIYGCGLRCMEVRNIELQHMDFDRKMLHIVQGKGRKDRYVPLSEHLIRGLKTFIKIENPVQYLFNGNQNRNIEEIDLKTDQSALQKPDFDSRYSQRGVQWVIKTISKKAGITKEVHTHTLRHSYATHLLEDGVPIIMVQKLLGHERIESTMEYLHVCQLSDQQPHSPLDTVFALCRKNGSPK